MSEIIPPASSTTEFYRPLEIVYVPRRKQRYWLHILLLLATVFTTVMVGARMQENFQRGQPALTLSDDDMPVFPMRWAFDQPSRLLLGLPFASTLMLILLAHEMGHYLFCLYYGVDATLPFFIPFPNFFGTMGAFIRIRSPIRSRTALFDIGIAGPIAGFVVATIVLLFSLPYSKVLASASTSSGIQLGYPLIFRLAWALAPISHARGTVALPDIYFHPAAIAAWVGMFATALNLLPGGQLDGGHIIFSIAPRAHKLISRLTIAALIPLAFFYCYIWLVWAIVLRLTSMRHPTVAEWPAVTGGRRWLAGVALLMLALTFAPAPVANASLIDVLKQLRGS
jgi:membrane-associated protease RseP (regulator of RpoE activity)